MVKRLRAFAGMSRMKRLALVVLARTLTDNDVKRLRVRTVLGGVLASAKVTQCVSQGPLKTLSPLSSSLPQELFVAMDTNQDGRIDSNDLHKALEKVGAAIDEVEMQELFLASDIDGTGQIDYEEFIAAMLDSNRVARRKEAVSVCQGRAGQGRAGQGGASLGGQFCCVGFKGLWVVNGEGAPVRAPHRTAAIQPALKP